MIINLIYPMGKDKVITFTPGSIDYVFNSVRGEAWYKCEVVCKDISEFSRANKKLLLIELDKCINTKHHLSKCNNLEEFICKLHKDL